MIRNALPTSLKSRLAQWRNPQFQLRPIEPGKGLMRLLKPRFSKCVALSQLPIDIRDGYAARRFLRWKRDRPCLLAYPKADFMTSGMRF